MIDYTGGEDGYTPQQASAHNFVDVNTLARHENPNYEGTPTQFFDNEGNLKAILADLHGQGSSQQFVDPYSFNPILKEGEKITADSARQAHNENNELLFLDAEGNQTTRNTGTPMVGGTLRDVMYEKDSGSRGGFLPKDAYQAAALFAVMASLGTLGPAFLASEGLLGAGALEGATAGELSFAGAGGAGSGGAGALGGAGAVAEAFPVSSGALLSGTELGGAGALTPEAATSLLEGLTTEQASNLMNYGLLPSEMQIPATGSLTATEALQYANRARQAVNAVQGATGGSGGATGGSGGATGGGGGSVNPNGPWNNNGQALAPGIISSAIHEQKPVIAGTEKLPMLFPSLDPALARQFAMSGNTGSNLGGDYFAYGAPPANSPLNNPLAQAPTYMKDGGGVLQSFKDGGKPHIPEFITGATGHYVKGRGDGQSDEIPAMLADGEYVFDADTVAQLGNGSSDAGAKVLDKMREAIRHHKRSAPVDSIPPKAKSPLEYIKQGMKRT
jgi:hypothetical protein